MFYYICVVSEPGMTEELEDSSTSNRTSEDGGFRKLCMSYESFK